MRIKNIDGLSAQDLQREVQKGGKFIHFPFTVSLLVLTFKRSSDVYLVREKENPVMKGMPFTIISFFLGWWGFPYGPRYTMNSIRTNLRGGKEVTEEVMATVAGHLLFMETEKEKQAGKTYSL